MCHDSRNCWFENDQNRSSDSEIITENVVFSQIWLKFILLTIYSFMLVIETADIDHSNPGKSVKFLLTFSQNWCLKGMWIFS